MNEYDRKTAPRPPLAILNELEAGAAMARGGQEVKLTMGADHIAAMIAAIKAGPDFTLVAALEESAALFRYYEASHKAKAKRAWWPATRRERMEKAYANGWAADKAEIAIARARSVLDADVSEAGAYAAYPRTFRATGAVRGRPL